MESYHQVCTDYASAPISAKQSLITSFFMNSKSPTVISDISESSTNDPNATMPSKPDSMPDPSIPNTILIPNSNIDTTKIESIATNESFNDPTSLSQTMDLDTSDKSLRHVINSGPLKRRIIEDTDDFSVEVTSIPTKIETLNYSTTNYVTENNLWDSSSSDNGENPTFDNPSPNLISDLNKFKYSDNPSETLGDDSTKTKLINNNKLYKDLKNDKFLNDQRKYYLDCHASKICKMFKDYIENYYLYNETFSFPPWIQPQYIKDSSGRRPDSTDYNPSTVLLPPPGHKWLIEHRAAHYTPTMRQYWSIKANHFDKLILFKMGKFYEIFYIDACIAHKICDLRWMGKESKPHIGFPEQSLQHFSSKLVNSGYKVVVVEQMETPKEMLEKTKGMRWTDKIISREICQILSKGTLLHSSMLPLESKPLLSIVFNDETSNIKESFDFATCIIDVSTNSINVSYHSDDESRLNLKTLLTRSNPAEILYIPNNVNKNIIELFKRSPMKPQLSHYELNNKMKINDFSTENTRFDEKKLNEMLNDNVITQTGKLLILKSMALASGYLSEMQLDTVMNSAEISLSDHYSINKLKLNSFVYDHLEIFTTSLGESKNSFFDFINNTSTPFGSRLLRQWVTSPSTDLSIINPRLDNVEWLVDNPQINNEIRRILATCMDLERQIGSITNTCTSKRAIKFDHIQSNKLLAFHKLLNGFEPFESLRSFLLSKIHNQALNPANNSNLSSLIMYDNQGGFYPNIQPKVKYFLDKLQIVDKQCYPKRGIYQKYDVIQDKIDYIIEHLHKELIVLSDSLGTNLTFVHSKFKYEIECSDLFQKKLASKYEITSTRKGFVRFRTNEIINYTDKLEDLEFERWECISEYFAILLHEFRNYIPEFSKAINIIAQIDCFSTFAYLVLSNNYPMCKPILHPMQGKPFLHLEHSIHPIIGLSVSNFIANDICMNCHHEANNCLLLTGPNMGGKSTLLRQICLITIMAQIGSFVPAKNFESTVVDKIYTRLGAYDSIMDGKSTFFVELEETSIMMEEASEYSLVMIDELGRGTSTYDGTAIASSSLQYIANNLRCRCIFSTHYHLICDEAKLIDTISLYYMASSVVNGELQLLFQFTKGECLKSQGLNVAKMAGIPESALRVAQNIADSMEVKVNEECSGLALLSECLHLLNIGDLHNLELLYINNKIN